MTVATRPIDATYVRRRVAALFAPRAANHIPRLGAEIEFFGIHRTADGCAPAPARDVEPMLSDSDLARLVPAEAAAGFEPGGQLEFSTRAHDGAQALLACAAEITAAARAAGARRGVELIACGTDPFHGRDAWPLAVDSPRYRVMQLHFDELGPRGRRMMRQTAALQVCVETPPAVMAEAWLLLNRAAPSLCALFANSPVLDTQRSGAAGERTAIWLDADATRTGFDAAQIDATDPINAYADFALRALAMPLPRAGRERVAPATIRFVDWLDDGGALEDADVDHHLSTLFPPVRPRGDYLEVRCIDALPARWTTVAVLVLSALVHDDAARREATQLLAATIITEATWRSAAQHGVRDRALAELGLALLSIAAAALQRGVPGAPQGGDRLVRQFRERFPESGRCPGDDLDDLFRLEPHRINEWI